MSTLNGHRRNHAIPGKLDNRPEMVLFHTFPASYIEPEDRETVHISHLQMTVAELPSVATACARDCRNLDRAAALWFGGAM